MQALIDFLIRNLMALWPIARIYEWEQGVRIRAGRLREELSPGLHWRWWFVDEIYRVTAVEQTVDLATASATTSDGIAIAVSANIAYRVRSVRRQWGAVKNLQQSVGNVAIGFIASKCTSETWDKLQRDRAGLQRHLSEHLTEQLASWGVEVTRVYLTDMVKANHWRLFGDLPTGVSL